MALFTVKATPTKPDRMTIFIPAIGPRRRAQQGSINKEPAKPVNPRITPPKKAIIIHMKRVVNSKPNNS